MNERLNEQGTYTLATHSIRVFGLMSLGVLVTFVTAYLVAQTTIMYEIYFRVGRYTPFLIIGLQIGTTILLGAKLSYLPKAVSYGLFFFYAILTGFVFSMLGAMYGARSIITAFAGAALFFGGMSIYGWITHRNLMSLRVVLTAGLIALLVTNIGMMFISYSTAFEQIVCSIGILVFVAYTAYDVQKMKLMYDQYSGDSEDLSKIAIYSAFSLYLDFINLFIYILRLLGTKRGRN